MPGSCLGMDCTEGSVGAGRLSHCHLDAFTLPEVLGKEGQLSVCRMGGGEWDNNTRPRISWWHARRGLTASTSCKRYSAGTQHDGRALPKTASGIGRYSAPVSCKCHDAGTQHDGRALRVSTQPHPAPPTPHPPPPPHPLTPRSNSSTTGLLNAPGKPPTCSRGC